LTKAVDPSGLNLKTTYSYDGQGRTLTVTDANNTATQYECDAKGQLKAVIVDPTGLNLRTEYTYDDAGHTLTVTEGASVPAETRTTQYVYDTLGRRIKEIKDPGTGHLNLTTEYLYANNDNVVTRIEGQGTPEERIPHYVYDANDRLAYTIDATGAVTQNQYDANNRVIKTTRYANKALLQDAATIDNLHSYYYDPGTNLFTQVAGRSIRLGLGAYQDLTPVYIQAAAYASGSNQQIGNPAITMSFDSDTVANWQGDINMPVLAAGSYRLVVQVWNDFISNRQTTLRITVDASGNVTRVIHTPSEIEVLLTADSTKDQVTRYAYDKDGRQVFSVDALGNSTEYVYDNNGNVVQTRAYASPIPSFNLPILDASPTRLTTLQSMLTPSTQDRITHAAYDKANRLRYSIDALGYVT
ncbi:MAG: hypothetical protein AAB263_02390, partial [Planctomycetota bacterium]